MAELAVDAGVPRGWFRRIPRFPLLPLTLSQFVCWVLFLTDWRNFQNPPSPAPSLRAFSLVPGSGPGIWFLNSDYFERSLVSMRAQVLQEENKEKMEHRWSRTAPELDLQNHKIINFIFRLQSFIGMNVRGHSAVHVHTTCPPPHQVSCAPQRPRGDTAAMKTAGHVGTRRDCETGSPNWVTRGGGGVCREVSGLRGGLSVFTGRSFSFCEAAARVYF